MKPKWRIPELERMVLLTITFSISTPIWWSSRDQEEGPDYPVLPFKSIFESYSEQPFVTVPQVCHFSSPRSYVEQNLPGFQAPRPLHLHVSMTSLSDLPSYPRCCMHPWWVLVERLSIWGWWRDHTMMTTSLVRWNCMAADIALHILSTHLM